MSTLYDELEVSPKASLGTIKAAYKALIQRYHPDKNPGNREAVLRTQRLNGAYEVLSDTDKRAAYDAQLSAEDPLNRDRVAERKPQPTRASQPKTTQTPPTPPPRPAQPPQSAPPPKPAPKPGGFMRGLGKLIMWAFAFWIGGEIWSANNRASVPYQPKTVVSNAAALVPPSAALTLTCRVRAGNEEVDENFYVDFGNRTVNGGVAQITDGDIVFTPYVNAGRVEIRINRYTGSIIIAIRDMSGKEESYFGMCTSAAGRNF